MRSTKSRTARTSQSGLRRFVPILPCVSTSGLPGAFPTDGHFFFGFLESRTPGRLFAKPESAASALCTSQFYARKFLIQGLPLGELGRASFKSERAFVAEFDRADGLGSYMRALPGGCSGRDADASEARTWKLSMARRPFQLSSTAEPKAQSYPI